MRFLPHLLSGAWRDPETGQPVTFPIQSVIIEPGAINHIADLLHPLPLGNRLLIVSDVNTYEVAGRAVEQALTGSYTVDSVTLPAGVKPSDAVVGELQTAGVLADAFIAIGSGTINDLCKYASHLEKKPYVIIGTAPSMNGYASANASIIMNGYKSTVPAQLPLAIILDTDLLACAPVRLIRAGLGDSLCRSTAQADWLLSHLLLGTPYRSTPFDWLTPLEPELFASAKGLVTGDRDALTLLTETLILSGLGMTYCRGSYPASQGEHMIAHTLEMALGETEPHTYHGEQIGVTTLTMARLQADFLSCPTIVLPLWDQTVIDQKITHYFGPALAESCRKSYRNKGLTRQRREELNARLDTEWPGITAQILPVTVAYATLERALSAAGAPTQPQAIGWKESVYFQSVIHASLSRDRLTFLDLLA